MNNNTTSSVVIGLCGESPDLVVDKVSDHKKYTSISPLSIMRATLGRAQHDSQATKLRLHFRAKQLAYLASQNGDHLQHHNQNSYHPASEGGAPPPQHHIHHPRDHTAAELMNAGLDANERAPVFNYSTWNHDPVFGFETMISGKDVQSNAIHYWAQLWLASAAYLAVIYGIKSAMATRNPFSLRVPLIVWNWALALFSLCGVLRMLPELVFALSNYGKYHSVCVASYAELNKVCVFWAWLFGLSKLVEFGDTVFIVLRKQPLIFLHWYHHITVLLYTFYSFTELTASGRWFITFNYLVHTVMYGYYALKAMRFRVPKSVAMSITILQVLQMIVGIYVNASAYAFKRQGMPCSVSYDNMNASFAMYSSYFLLFLNFFYRAYLCKGNKDKWASRNNATESKAITSSKKVD
ncbi:unnamed protein product [Notodromas monacha]|uniref:Elongation of very long chain fatty acids protein n=1 Tax=Notodromas monacha TaxID=399045 RepID=A0A7R9BG91_9CRUS|nr:unnamed protein product [Notodromas monacha]CAG0913889.1 unnamed protein product [Notodromas monacha]